jgi:hypothetical protein
MFGYITADPSQLQEEEIGRYSGCYCGLCRCLQKRHGFFGRITLTYDMTFLILTLSSLYEPEETRSRARCPVHPLKKRDYWQNRFTDYAADLNLMLAWWNCEDDWKDEKKLSRHILAKLLEKRCKSLAKKYPRQAAAIERELQNLSQYEDGPQVNADKAAACFGRLMGELFVYSETEYWAPTLRALGQGLGEFIYIMDACMDYESDGAHGRPNPLRALDDGNRTREEDYDVLTMLLSSAAAALEKLPLEQDLGLLRNILYAGVWQKYNDAFYRRDRRKERDGEGETHT